MKTATISAQNHKKKWLVFDAENQALGRLASKICHYLRGKDKVYFSPNLDCGDNVIVINSKKIFLSGNKWKDKIYYSHSEYPGGLKAKSALYIHNKNSTQLIRMAVQRMLPKSRLAREQIKSLYIYSGSQHQHQGQKPIAMDNEK